MCGTRTTRRSGCGWARYRRSWLRSAAGSPGTPQPPGRHGCRVPHRASVLPRGQATRPAVRRRRPGRRELFDALPLPALLVAPLTDTAGRVVDFLHVAQNRAAWRYAEAILPRRCCRCGPTSRCRCSSASRG
ncbi:hypothetical protein GXW82_15315 [Streptacidiphilus sp. 4-A2]|nr:hypothetical protein [Streptacidiphilus sp. 4-A2]